jgi:hypothetical protein
MLSQDQACQNDVILGKAQVFFGTLTGLAPAAAGLVQRRGLEAQFKILRMLWTK